MASLAERLSMHEGPHTLREAYQMQKKLVERASKARDRDQAHIPFFWEYNPADEQHHVTFAQGEPEVLGGTKQLKSSLKSKPSSTMAAGNAKTEIAVTPSGATVVPCSQTTCCHAHAPSTSAFHKQCTHTQQPSRSVRKPSKSVRVELPPQPRKSNATRKLNPACLPTVARLTASTPQTSSEWVRSDLAMPAPHRSHHGYTPSVLQTSTSKTPRQKQEVGVKGSGARVKARVESGSSARIRAVQQQQRKSSDRPSPSRTTKSSKQLQSSGGRKAKASGSTAKKGSCAGKGRCTTCQRQIHACHPNPYPVGTRSCCLAEDTCKCCHTPAPIPTQSMPCSSCQYRHACTTKPQAHCCCCAQSPPAPVPSMACTCGGCVCQPLKSAMKASNATAPSGDGTVSSSQVPKLVLPQTMQQHAQGAQDGQASCDCTHGGACDCGDNCGCTRERRNCTGCDVTPPSDASTQCTHHQVVARDPHARVHFDDKEKEKEEKSQCEEGFDGACSTVKPSSSKQSKPVDRLQTVSLSESEQVGGGGGEDGDGEDGESLPMDQHQTDDEPSMTGWVSAPAPTPRQRRRRLAPDETYRSSYERDFRDYWAEAQAKQKAKKKARDQAKLRAKQQQTTAMNERPRVLFGHKPQATSTSMTLEEKYRQAIQDGYSFSR
eukprot:m.265121 g.265121  ORF g.265121 m.265121 type:complete len:660 (-) comp15626_c2_seq7:476-2455(-)